LLVSKESPKDRKYKSLEYLETYVYT